MARCKRCNRHIKYRYAIETGFCYNCYRNFIKNDYDPYKHNYDKPNPIFSFLKKYKLIFLSLLVILFLVNFSFFEDIMDSLNLSEISIPLVSQIITKTCSDSTSFGNCSAVTQYKYCNNFGLLVFNASVCGCPWNYDKLDDDCFERTCSDGTSYDVCSDSKPFYCDNGRLVEKASVCGCPYNKVEENNNCLSKFMTGSKEVTFRYVVNGVSRNMDNCST